MSEGSSRSRAPLASSTPPSNAGPQAWAIRGRLRNALLIPCTTTMRATPPTLAPAANEGFAHPTECHPPTGRHIHLTPHHSTPSPVTRAELVRVLAFTRY